MDRIGSMLYLRPVRGGCEWVAARDEVRPVEAVPDGTDRPGPSAELRARVAEVNAWSRRRM